MPVEERPDCTRLITAAREVVRAWHEDIAGLSSLTDAIADQQDALEDLGHSCTSSEPQDRPAAGE